MSKAPEKRITNSKILKARNELRERRRIFFAKNPKLTPPQNTIENKKKPSERMKGKEIHDLKEKYTIEFLRNFNNKDLKNIYVNGQGLVEFSAEITMITLILDEMYNKLNSPSKRRTKK